MNLPVVLIPEPLAPAPLEWLSTRAQVIHPASTLISAEELEAADALIVRTYTRVDSTLLDRAPNLRVIARAGVGLDNIDLDACRARDIPVVHTPNANTEAVVEYVMSMLLGALRPIAQLDHQIDPSQWGALRDDAISPGTCVGASLGIIGMGRIGQRVARCAAALAMHTTFHDLIEIDPADRHGASSNDLESIARESHAITIHIDGREENRNIIDQSFFDHLRDDVVLINASRGMVMDTRAAIRFAQSHPDAKLILDVHDPEPIPMESLLWSLPNVTLTPHIAAGTRQAKEEMSWVVRDVVRVLNGEAPRFPAY